MARFPPEQRAQILAMQQRLREQQAQQQQAMAAPPPPPLDPALQALLDSNYQPVSLSLPDEDRMTVVCKEHGDVTCEKCGTDFASLNELAEQLNTAFGKDGVPPPPPPPNQPGMPNGGPRTQRMTKFKDEGNTMFKKGQHALAAKQYTNALDIAASRPPWEPHVILREELAMVLSNRSAAYVADNELDCGLWDADAVIGLKRPWSKGHFRKAKALMGMGRYQEAKEALELGLSFDPDSEEMKKTVEDIERMSEKDNKAVVA